MGGAEVLVPGMIMRLMSWGTGRLSMAGTESLGQVVVEFAMAAVGVTMMSC
jgi:hypothetical protein